VTETELRILVNTCIASRIGKDFERSIHGLIGAVSLHLPGGTEETSRPVLEESISETRVLALPLI
jgi:hypothetical protein